MRGFDSHPRLQPLESAIYQSCLLPGSLPEPTAEFPYVDPETTAAVGLPAPSWPACFHPHHAVLDRACASRLELSWKVVAVRSLVCDDFLA
jgi:hypothetical protein